MSAGDAANAAPATSASKAPAVSEVMPASTPTAVGKIQDVVFAFLPAPVQRLRDKGLLNMLLSMVFVVVILPPLLAYLAAFWVKQLGNVDSDVARGVRKEIITMIDQGFSFAEVASKSNSRLDYFQLLEIDLKAKKKPWNEVRISIQRNQRAVIDITSVRFVADDASCTIPENLGDVVEISLGGRVISRLREGNNFEAAELSEEWWREFGSTSAKNAEFQRLSFNLIGKAGEASCGSGSVEGAVMVFKDLLTKTNEGR